MSEHFTLKLIVVAAATLLGLILGLLASLLLDDNEWQALSSRVKWGHRLVGLGIAIVVGLGFFAATDELSDRSIFGLLSAVGVLSFAGIEGRKRLLKGNGVKHESD